MILKTILILLLFFGSVQVYGQEYSFPISNTPKDQTVNISVGHTDLKVVGNSDNSITIKSLKEIRSKDERAEGLTPVTPWPDNTGLGIHISNQGNKISIVKPIEMSDVKYEISIPSWMNIEIEETEWGSGKFEVSDFQGDIKIESGSSDIKISNVSGSIQAQTTSGEMEIEMPSSKSGKKHEIESVSGTTNLMIVKYTGYSFDLSTVSGLIQTDFETSREIEYKGSVLRRISRSKEIETVLYGGGDLVKASTVSGVINIFYKE